MNCLAMINCTLSDRCWFRIHGPNLRSDSLNLKIFNGKIHLINPFKLIVLIVYLIGTV